MKINFQQIMTKQYWQYFFTSSFWFSMEDYRVRYLDYGILFVGAFLAIFGLVMLVLSKKKFDPFTKELYVRFGKVPVVTGFLLVLWFGLRYQNINFLGFRFMAGLVVLSGVFWVYWVYKKIGKKYHVNLSNWKKEQLKQKYLKMQAR